MYIGYRWDLERPIRNQNMEWNFKVKKKDERGKCKSDRDEAND